LYANTGITHLSKLITLNNQTLRILQNKAYNAPVKELCTDYNTLLIDDDDDDDVSQCGLS